MRFALLGLNLTPYLQRSAGLYILVLVLPEAKRRCRGLLQYVIVLLKSIATHYRIDLGRAFHQLNLVHLAVPYYEKV